MNSDEYNSEDSSSDEELEQSVKGTAAAIVLINVFDPESRKSWEQAHVATCRLIRHHLRTQSTQFIGVSLYGTDDDDTSIFAQKSIKDVFPLKSPSLDDFNQLKQLDISKVKQCKELVLSEVLSHCSKMFSACKKILSLRTIIMLTSLDQPPARYDREPTMKYIEDLVHSGIAIKIVNVARTEYKVHEFYNEFLFEAYKVEEDKDLMLPKHVWDAEEIENNIITHCDRHITIAELPFELGTDVKVGVKICTLLKSVMTPKTSYIDKETNAPVIRKKMLMKKTNNIQDMDTDKKPLPLISEEIIKFQEYGGEKQEFSKSDFTSMKNAFGPPVLKLLGFKPENTLPKEKWFTKKCYFLFPTEGKIEGSTVAFRALYHACKEMKVMSICMLLTRKNAKPQMVALSPSSKPFGINVDLGFDVIILPFVENLKDLPEINDQDSVEISNEQQVHMDAMMNDVIDKLKFDYQPEMFENPVLQYKYRMIETKALNDIEFPEIKDTTSPKDNSFTHIDVDQFNKLFGPFGSTVAKRAASIKPSTVNKKTKSGDVDLTLLEENIKNKNIDKYSNDQLRQILRNLNITAGLSKKNKTELVGLVYDHYAYNANT